MTVQYILRAALASMLAGKRQPSCYHAHIPGKGYVNAGDTIEDLADYRRQLQRTCESAIDNLQWANEYAEPGYAGPVKGIIFANWNAWPKGLDRVLEQAGYTIEWEDEWSVCGDCNRAVRTSPDGWDWRPSYRIVDTYELLCSECAEDREPATADEEEN